MHTFETTAAPAGARWTTTYEIAPGASNQVERHAEAELWVIVGGSALVEVAGQITRVEAGYTVIFEPMESHVAHNDSADRPLFIAAARWTPAVDDSVPIARAA